MTHRLPLAAATAAAILLPAPAPAHARMLAATPAAGATVAAPDKVALKFSERLLPNLSGGTLMLTGASGKPRSAIAVNGIASSVGADGRTLTLAPARRLAAGSYRVDWHVVSADTHRVAGSYGFTVR